MSLVIPDEILHSTHMSETRVEPEKGIAVLLFQKEKLTLGQPANWLG